MTLGERLFSVDIAPEGRALVLKVDGSGFRATVEASAGGYRVQVGSREHEVRVEGDRLLVNGRALEISVAGMFGAPGGTAEGPSAAGPQGQAAPVGGVYPPMPGRVISVSVQPGDFVKVGTPLLVLEAMKMQNEIPSPREGRVKEVRVSPGQSVGPRDLLVILE